MKQSFGAATYKVIRNAVLDFIDDEALSRAGALAFFAIFSIPPLLIIVMDSVSLFAGQEVANSELFTQINAIWGERLATQIQQLITDYSAEFSKSKSFIQSLIGLVVFLVSSTSFFLYIQYSLNSIWNVKHKPQNAFHSLVKNRIFSFGFILLLVVLILTSILLDSFLFILHQWLDSIMLLNTLTSFLYVLAGYLLSYLFVGLIIALIFKYLPDVKMKWEVAIVGAAITSILFGVGKLVLGLIIGSYNIQDTYGIVGSLILVMLWVYYSAAILYFGAELTQHYGIVRSKKIQAGKDAVLYTIKEIKISD